MNPVKDAVDNLHYSASPDKKDQLSSFFGCTSYSREFIPDYAAKAHPMKLLIRSKHVSFQQTFDSPRAAGTIEVFFEAVALALPNEDRHVVLDLYDRLSHHQEYSIDNESGTKRRYCILRILTSDVWFLLILCVVHQKRSGTVTIIENITPHSPHRNFTFNLSEGFIGKWMTLDHEDKYL